jgi:hypothetical protein
MFITYVGAIQDEDSKSYLRGDSRGFSQLQEHCPYDAGEVPFRGGPDWEYFETK